VNRSGQKILFADSLGGLVVGAVLLSNASWFAQFYGFPWEVVVFVSGANISYGMFSGTLALLARARGAISRSAIIILIVANCLWTIPSVGLTFWTWPTSTSFGIGHLWLEAIVVCVLAYLEAKWVLPEGR